MNDIADSVYVASAPNSRASVASMSSPSEKPGPSTSGWVDGGTWKIVPTAPESKGA